MPLWFLRHGESEANARGRYAGGGEDSPLTTRGKSQARCALEQLPKDISWVVTSPLARAYETAMIVRDALNGDIQLEVENRLAEYDMGAMSGMAYQDVSTEELVTRFGAEDPNSFWLRVTTSLDELLERDGTGLLVAHTGVARVFVARREGLSPYEFRRAPVPQNGVPFLME
ncbi:MAG: histidine phosphatase family protein [Acidimicrobiales bacterium]